MRALLDVNVLIALFDADHLHHDLAWRWFQSQSIQGWASCPLTQNGCLRIMSQPRYPNPIPLRELIDRLTRASLAPTHEFWPDEISVLDHAIFDRSRIHSSSQLTDLYLLGLAVSRDAGFATFDRSIPLSAVRGAKPRHLILI